MARTAAPPILSLVEPWQAEEADMEVRALRHERRTLATDLAHLSRLLERAVGTERLDIVQQAAGRLAYLADSLTRRETAS